MKNVISFGDFSIAFCNQTVQVLSLTYETILLGAGSSIKGKKSIVKLNIIILIMSPKDTALFRCSISLSLSAI